MKKMNFIDFLIIAVIVVVVAVGGFTVYSLRDKNESEENLKPVDKSSAKEITYEILCEKVEPYVVNELKKQKEIYSLDTNGAIGKVLNVRVEDYFVVHPDQYTGKIVKSKSPEFKNVFITVEAKATELGNGKFKIGTTEIFSTRVINIKGPYFVANAKIWNFIEVK